MRIFAFIMAVIILALNGVQCMDSVTLMKNDGAKAEILKSNNPQEHSNTDDCSPFCTCSCCSSFTYVVTNIKAEPTIHASEKLHIGHLPSSVVKVSLPIWQPPQLAC